MNISYSNIYFGSNFKVAGTASKEKFELLRKYLTEADKQVNTVQIVDKGDCFVIKVPDFLDGSVPICLTKAGFYRCVAKLPKI